MTVKVLKLITGEEVLAEVLEESAEAIKVKNMIAIVVQRTQNGPALGLLPWMPYVNGEISLNRATLVLVSEVDTELKNQYNNIFGSGIITPPKELIVG
jgi:hypothetical protein